MNTIDVDQLNKRLSEGDDIILIDVREDYEREEFNIGGMHIPMGEIPAKLDDLRELDDSKEVVLYCRSGNRSGSVQQFLAEVGIKTTNLVGGMMTWQEKVGK